MYKIINPRSFPPSRRPALHLHIFSAYLNYKFCPSLRGHPVPCCQNTLRSDHFQIPVQFPGENPDREEEEERALKSAFAPSYRSYIREQGEIVAWWGDVGDALGKKSGRFALIGTRLAL